MKLFTKDIDKDLYKQYRLGADLDSQVVVTKIFNPYANMRWFLINSDVDDPDYIWAIVQMGDNVEVGSVSRSELETIRVSRFRLPLERDLGFRPVNAGELLRGLREGKFYKKGGWVENENKEMAENQATEVKHHSEELSNALKNTDHVEAWVVGKMERATTDLSDVTHYLDGESKKMADGGMMAKGGGTKNLNVISEKELFGILDVPKNQKIQSGKIYTNKKGEKLIIDWKGNDLVLREIVNETNESGKADLKDLFIIGYADGGMMAKGGGVDNYKHFELNAEGNFASELNGKNYEVIYRDDKSQMYDLFEDGKKIKSSKYVREVMTFADGGKIKDQYEGRTPEDIWNNLSKSQRQHFIYDHAVQIEDYRGEEHGELTSKEIIRAYNSDYKDLDKDIKNRFNNHTRDVQYADGGEVNKYAEVFDKLKKGDKVKITFGSSISKQNKAELLVKSKNIVGKGKSYESEKITFENTRNPQGIKFYAYKRKSGYVGFAMGDMAISDVQISFEDKMAKGGTIKVGDKVRSTTFKGVEGEVISKKGDMLFVRKHDATSNGDMQHDVLRIDEVEKMADGGVTNGMEVVNYLKSVSGVRASYIAEWGDKNNVDLAQVEKAIKTKKLKPIDFSTALSGRDGNKYAKEIISKYSQNKMAKGGMSKKKVTFDDKVKAIQSSLLKRKKVSPKVQKDYGKTYNKKEALQSAKRIAGAMRKKGK